MTVSIETKFLSQIHETKQDVSVFLVNGIRLMGMIAGFDEYSLFLQGQPGSVQMIYKKAIATIVPEDKISIKNLISA